MATAKRLRHQRAARADLLEIWDYSKQVWGRKQADSYLTKIDLALRNIASGRARGSSYKGRYLKRRIDAHVIFYSETAKEIVIVRVLHGHMDFDRHLPG